MSRCHICRSLALVPQRFGTALVCCGCYDARAAFGRIMSEWALWWSEQDRAFVTGRTVGMGEFCAFSGRYAPPVEPGTEELARRRRGQGPVLPGEAAL